MTREERLLEKRIMRDPCGFAATSLNGQKAYVIQWARVVDTMVRSGHIVIYKVIGSLEHNVGVSCVCQWAELKRLVKVPTEVKE